MTTEDLVDMGISNSLRAILYRLEFGKLMEIVSNIWEVISFLKKTVLPNYPFEIVSYNSVLQFPDERKVEKFLSF